MATQDNNMVIEQEAQIKTQRSSTRGGCCCCCRTRQGRLITAIVILLFLGGLAIAGYFLWPQIPDITMDAIQVQSSQFTVSPVISINVGMNVQVHVANNNRYAISIDEIDVNADLLRDGQDPITDIATGKTGSLILSQQAITSFPVPINVQHSLQENVAITADPLINELMTSCGLIDSSTKRPMQLSYTVTVHLTVLAFTGYAPSFTSQTSIDCPLSDQDAQLLQTQYNNAQVQSVASAAVAAVTSVSPANVQNVQAQLTQTGISQIAAALPTN